MPLAIMFQNIFKSTSITLLQVLDFYQLRKGAVESEDSESHLAAMVTQELGRRLKLFQATFPGQKKENLQLVIRQLLLPVGML